MEEKCAEEWSNFTVTLSLPGLTGTDMRSRVGLFLERRSYVPCFWRNVASTFYGETLVIKRGPSVPSCLSYGVCGWYTGRNADCCSHLGARLPIGQLSGSNQFPLTSCKDARESKLFTMSAQSAFCAYTIFCNYEHLSMYCRFCWTSASFFLRPVQRTCS